ncbi:MAG TPA: ferrochelatase [Mycobacteriales bacterium]|nr:ferrochelatase [Mycobacteriales bacterium]
MTYDALLLVSFGGPEGPDDVLPFLRTVTRGRSVPAERLAEVASHYQHFGGVSPINAQNRALLAALRAAVDLPVYWGNRNWHPFLAEAIREMAQAGVRRALAFVTAAYMSYSSCRQYLDDIEGARRAVGPDAPVVERLRHFFNHPGFVRPMVRHTQEALAALPAERRTAAHLVFTAHSIPVTMAEESGPAGGAYPAQVREAAALVAAGVGGGHPWQVAYQSRSGPPSVPWLDPDVLDVLRALAASGTPAAVLVPVGFVSDHVEVVYDLDVEAAELAASIGLATTRAATVGTAPEFVAMVADLVAERRGPAASRTAVGRIGPAHDTCPTLCCGGSRLDPRAG